MLWLYGLILLVVALGLWAAYRVLGTPSRLASSDYVVVLADLVASVERSAARLREAIKDQADESREEAAKEARKIFQTGYFQSLRLRPAAGSDPMASARTELGRACEAYDWASRMVGGDSLKNPLIREALDRLLDTADAALRRAALQLPASAVPAEKTVPSG